MCIFVSLIHTYACVPYVRRKELESEIRAQVDELMREELKISTWRVHVLHVVISYMHSYV